MAAPTDFRDAFGNANGFSSSAAQQSGQPASAAQFVSRDRLERSPADSRLSTAAPQETFLKNARRTPSDDYLKSTRTPPISQYEIEAGWEIPAVMEQGLNSDLPGEVKALVTSNVCEFSASVRN